MNTISYSQRYLPHKLSTRYHAVKLYRTGVGVSFVCRRYHISKASLMRWNKKFDGTKESLLDKSHKPHTPHPNAHTAQELKWIKDYHRRNPKISVCELYGKLRTCKGYSRHPASLYRIYRSLGYSSAAPSTKKKSSPKPYDTPTELGIKWQLDVKYVPVLCYKGSVPQKFYQYTIIDEASRQRFIYPYMEQSSYSTIDFVKRAIPYFGYKPLIIQTDNGGEFTHLAKTSRMHPFDIFCSQAGITHKLIRPRTPQHNGKVERSHRNDQERFYNHISFYDYSDLVLQMKRYLKRSNNIPMQVLDWKSPLQKRHELERH
ncbi:MAG: DDE-type integrase/transposase/recombinase [Bacteroides sp.]|nr:DDE-type integrase/transposase/recombinase [Bacteroides sp.]MCM1549339.1 DDE-type integrase/transposase/recombinase [Clostridium sp.]